MGLTPIKLLMKYVIKVFILLLVGLSGQGTVVFSFFPGAFTITSVYFTRTSSRTCMTSTAIEASVGGVIAIIQTVRVCLRERSSRKDSNQENETCDFVVRHLVYENSGTEDRNSIKCHLYSFVAARKTRRY